MADVSKEKLRGILAQAEAAAKKIRQQRDHVWGIQFLLLADDKPSDAAGLKRIKGFISGVIENHHHEGLEAGSRDLTAVLTMAASSGASLALNSSFPVMSEEQLHDALVAHAEQIPEGSTAFSRVEAALFAVKLALEHHLPRCVLRLAQIRIPDPDAAATGEPPQDDGGDTGLPAPAQAKDKVPKEESGGSLEQARDYLDRAYILVNLAVQHVDLSVAAMSSFLDLDPAEEDDAKPSDDSDEFFVIT
ncbi:uncharacterized protein LOC106866005 [Brachypodium distachyon]|uniref:Uncharacterized protein n=1 Tax=Brachypodium distachyon TaxID=15368 RepID=A0A0Q3FT54_BRADI|nr:uncharacterized protein LOC106866005 [Brachypodium distachyon]KQK02319.2 hypothetical protein BRADI_2g00783v3 [Brachypodium distachyon]|eukprot:XP_014753964.1 uncharacterized protein LOC106866005 [Brachypodium distachyon]